MNLTKRKVLWANRHTVFDSLFLGLCSKGEMAPMIVVQVNANPLLVLLTQFTLIDDDRVVSTSRHHRAHAVLSLPSSFAVASRHHHSSLCTNTHITRTKILKHTKNFVFFYPKTAPFRIRQIKTTL